MPSGGRGPLPRILERMEHVNMTSDPVGWSRSDRRKRLPKDWERIRARILRRDPVCYVCRERPSQEVDHIVRGDNHDDSNLGGICTWCHRRKTSAEGRAARRPPPSRRRPEEPHPGE